MNGTTLERPDVAAYLDAVRSELADLPADERDDLLADVEASLLDSGEPPRLAPADFAAELREAAGFEPGAPAAAAPQSLLDAIRTWLSSDRAAALRGTARELAPIWWLARAYVAVVVIALALGQGWPVGAGTSGKPISLEQSVLALVVAVALSIRLGLRGKRERPAHPRLRLAVNVALALALVPVAVHSFDQLAFRGYSEPIAYYEPPPGLAYDGVQVRNIYPYTRDGKRLFDVLLFDENGRPVEIGSGPDDTSRRILTAVDGSQLFNSFPIRYFEPGTKTVAQPELGPPVTVQEIATPELERPSR